MNSITQDYLKEVLDYNPETGIFTWKIDKGTGKAGCLAANHNSKGYIRIGLDGTSFTAHRLAWLYVYGEWPKGHIDHINRIRDDNRIVNLRIVSIRENGQNRIEHALGKQVGTHFYRHLGKWGATIQVGNQPHYMGLYPTEEEAAAKYQEALNHLTDPEWFKQFKRKQAKGYYWDRSRGKWFSQIKVNGKNKYLGHFSTEAEAREAYLSAKQEKSNDL